MLVDTSFRSAETELMDDPNIGKHTLLKVYKDINRANTILNGNRITTTAIALLIKEFPKPNYTVLDMGCGDGSMLRKIASFFKKMDIEVHLLGIDLNEKAIEIAKAKSKDFPEIEFRRQDFLKLNADALNADIVTTTLTMHHFTDGQIPIFLKQSIALANIGVVINDLQRSRLSYYLFKVFSVIFIRTTTAKKDGLTSIRRGFTKAELLTFSSRLSFMEHAIKWKWGFRYLWIIKSNKQAIKVNE